MAFVLTEEQQFLRSSAQQFDVPIGSFQSLQHRTAHMFCERALCQSVVSDALSAPVSQLRCWGMPIIKPAATRVWEDINQHAWEA